jgi:hypothetical protein
LLAGRAGESARGFGVLSGQLREFTRGLAVSMDRLGMLIDGAVDAVSDHMRHRRLMSLLLCTADLDERCADLIAPALQSGAAATVRRLDRVTERRGENRKNRGRLWGRLPAGNDGRLRRV